VSRVRRERAGGAFIGPSCQGRDHCGPAGRRVRDHIAQYICAAGVGRLRLPGGEPEIWTYRRAVEKQRDERSWHGVDIRDDAAGGQLVAGRVEQSAALHPGGQMRVVLSGDGFWELSESSGIPCST